MTKTTPPASSAALAKETLNMLRTYTVVPIRYKEKGYCGTCEGYETIVAQMADENGDEWEVCADCLKDFREQAARFGSSDTTALKALADELKSWNRACLAAISKGHGPPDEQKFGYLMASHDKWKYDYNKELVAKISKLIADSSAPAGAKE
jgi:hypothetical protein